MIVLRDPSDLPRIANPAIWELVELRFRQLISPDGPDAPDADGCFIVVEAKDAVSEIEQAAGYPILTGLFDDLYYTDPDFQPSCEIFEEHRNEHICIYEMVYISDDDGVATTVIFPNEEGINRELLAFANAFATPALSTP